MAESSVGKCPLVRMARRNLEGEKRDDLRPVPAPSLRDQGVFLAPRAGVGVFGAVDLFSAPRR